MMSKLVLFSFEWLARDVLVSKLIVVLLFRYNNDCLIVTPL